MKGLFQLDQTGAGYFLPGFSLSGCFQHSLDVLIALIPLFPIFLLSFEMWAQLRTGFFAKNGVFWAVTPCGSCKNGRFGGT
jgi:hypothetical protein